MLIVIGASIFILKDHATDESTIGISTARDAFFHLTKPISNRREINLETEESASTWLYYNPTTWLGLGQ